MFSAIFFSHCAKAGRGRTIRRERGMNFQKGRPVQGARMARWGREIRESDRDQAQGRGKSFMPFQGEKVTQGLAIRSREDVLLSLKEQQRLRINREGQDYISAGP